MTDNTTPKEVTQAAMTEAGDLLPVTQEDIELAEWIVSFTKGFGITFRQPAEHQATQKVAAYRHRIEATRAPITPSDRSQRAVVEAARNRLRIHGRLIDYPGGEMGFARDAAIAALQPPAADNATRTEDGLAGEVERIAGWIDVPGYSQESYIALAKLLPRILTALRTTGQPAIAAADNGALERAKEALRKADQFISNGIELGYIRMPDPDTPDSAHETPGIVRHALAALEAKPVGEADV